MTTSKRITAEERGSCRHGVCNVGLPTLVDALVFVIVIAVFGDVANFKCTTGKRCVAEESFIFYFWLAFVHDVLFL